MIEDFDSDGIEDAYDLDDDGDGYSDLDEIFYGSDPLDPNSLPNRPPTEIILISNAVEENLPVGTIVGHLRTVDFDDPNGTGIYEYAMDITGQGSDLFSLDKNGTLLTKRELDYEDKSIHQIKVRVNDHLGAYLDQNLTISVIDSFIPIVETGDPVDVGFQEAVLTGKLLDKGSNQDLVEIGMLVSRNPRPDLDVIGVIKEQEFLDAHESFEAMIMGLEKGRKYFYRTYAINAEGVGYGVVKDFVTKQQLYAPDWAKAQPASVKNWWTSAWFGSFYMNDANASWIMHSELGWLYSFDSGRGGIWLWKEKHGLALDG